MAIREFTDLKAWQEAHNLTLSIYRFTKLFPGDEKFGLVSQLRRAVVSIESNIVEGFGRKTAKDKSQFYMTAKSSLLEVHAQMIIAKDLQYISQKDFEAFIERRNLVGKLLSGLTKSAINQVG